jgi:hypothetical protein
MATFQFYLQSGTQRIVGWVGNDSRVVFGQNFPAGKEECVTVSCRASEFVLSVYGSCFVPRTLA